MNHPNHLQPRFLLAAAVLALASLPFTSATSQFIGPGTGGAIELAQELRFLPDGRRVLVIGAHPDDEDTELITILSRGLGIETAYLSLTRGEGGQNLIGSELGAALGVVRTGELLAARRIDGGHQFFSRAIDFGFTKTARETFTFWPHDSLVKDVVRIIRRFRPEVIVSVWTGTPADGHGQHQVSGIVAREAFDSAQDSTAFPGLARDEGLQPWRPLKFYRDYRASGPGASFDGGALDPAAGQSYHQLAARSRSSHRSQGMGQYQQPGPSRRHIALEAVARGLDLARDTALFAGVPAIPSRDPALGAKVRLAQAGVILDAYTDDAEVVPGQPVPSTLLVWNEGENPVRAHLARLVHRGFGAGTGGDCPGGEVVVKPGEVFRCQLPLRVRDDAQPGQEYFLRQPADGSLYSWSGDPAHWGDPFDPPLAARFEIDLADGTSASMNVPITARSLDRGLGEVRTPVVIVPREIVSVSPAHLLWKSDRDSTVFTVTVEHAARDTVAATVALTVPAPWRVDAPRKVVLTREGEHDRFQFTVHRPEGVRSGPVNFAANVIVGSDTFGTSVERIDYSHIQPHHIFSPALVNSVVAPVHFAANQRIGYLRGAADRIPEALTAAGVNFRLLSSSDLEGSALDSLDVVVIGPRAYGVDPELDRANARLLDFARRGGTLVVQYQQYGYVNAGLAPYPFTIARPHDRVTDETAAVRWLPGSDALRNLPNKLTTADFAGWVQERGLYFAHDWDSAWKPMVAMHDPGESALDGGLLVARYGKGTVVYTGLSFFRELPAAVPGAWRLFANILAVGRDG